MDTEQLVKEIRSVDTLCKDGIITQEKCEVWKAKILADFENASFPQETKKEMPGDLAHLPGRLVGGIIGALGHINGARCAGVAPEQHQNPRAKSPQELMDGLPEQYR
jgi:hypothetical protein